VARKGGIAPHQKRGLAAANSDTRMRVAKAGGEARAQDREGLSEAGRRGGAVKERYGTEFYSEIGKRGGETVKQERGAEYYSTIGRKGGESRTTTTIERKPGEDMQPTTSEPSHTTNTQVSTAA
jgi:general stress protein YciG